MTVVLLISGCASLQVAKPPIKSNRIVYRDLTRPKEITYPMPHSNMSINPVEPQSPEKSPSEPVGYRPEHFIEFANDSTRRFDKKGLQAFLAENDHGSHILVIGHSHGKSAVGTLGLASKRAQTIARHLTRRGYQNVHVMASWGAAPVWFAPGRGVHIYVIGKNADPANVPIIFARDVEEKQNEDPQDFIPIAGFAAQGGVDGI